MSISWNSVVLTIVVVLFIAYVIHQVKRERQNAHARDLELARMGLEQVIVRMSNMDEDGVETYYDQAVWQRKTPTPVDTNALRVSASVASAVQAELEKMAAARSLLADEIESLKGLSSAADKLLETLNRNS